jgi:hypothetical protein
LGRRLDKGRDAECGLSAQILITFSWPEYGEIPGVFEEMGSRTADPKYIKHKMAGSLLLRRGLALKNSFGDAL